MEKNIVNNNGEEMNVNHQSFKLVLNPNASYKDYGWTKEFVHDMLYVAECEPNNEWMSGPEILNNLGIIYSDAVGVERDMTKAIHYYEMAVKKGDDLARSNLADIYRKGSYGVPKDAVKAFKLYNECHLPYAFYRVGEAYENGWGVEKDIEQAKKYYRVAYKEGHGLARKKLKTFNFLVD